MSAGTAGSKKPETVREGKPGRAWALLRELDTSVWDVIEEAAAPGAPPLVLIDSYVQLRTELKRFLAAADSRNASLAPPADVPAQPQAPPKPSSTAPRPVAARQPARPVGEPAVLVAKWLRADPDLKGPQAAQRLTEAGHPVVTRTAQRLLKKARG